MECNMVAHLRCLARWFLYREGDDHDLLIPLSGPCPCCHRTFLWGDVVVAVRLRLRSIAKLSTKDDKNEAGDGSNDDRNDSSDDGDLVDDSGSEEDGGMTQHLENLRLDGRKKIDAAHDDTCVLPITVSTNYARGTLDYEIYRIYWRYS